jgi:type IV pilus assembly protein PilA
MHTRNKVSNYGFTIVELLIVVVVIAILAAITVVAYNGISQRATTSSINSSVKQWATLIQTNNLNSGFKFPNNAATCLGSSSNDYPAKDGFAAGVCVNLDGVTFVSYNASSYTGWSASQPRPSGLNPIVGITLGSSSLSARGIWTAASSNTNVELRWISPTSNQCGVGTVLGGTTSAGAYCSYVIDYQN